MERIPEPELMLDPEQALAYARADFEEAHGRIVATFFERFPDLPPQGTLIDLGCGPGDITLRLARRLEGWRVDGLDGSPAMLRLAREALGREPALAGRVRFLEGRLPEAPPASARYDAIFSNSLLHHLPEPAALWATIRRCAAPGAAVFVADLFRPPSEEAARALVELHAVG
ncbi:MAG: class I SAM-dependent methyltransferase, partial [Verrucomicrobia bacterium]